MSRKDLCTEKLIDLSNKNGYLLIDEIIGLSEEFELEISVLDEICEELNLRDIQILEERPSNHLSDKKEEYVDYSRTDYNSLYNEIKEISEGLTPLVEFVESVPPPQYGERPRLLEQIAKGDSIARERLIVSHLRIVLKLALSCSKKNDYDLEDATLAGIEGLVEALERYDEFEYPSFQSYISFRIISKIERECRPKWMEYYYPVHMRQSVSMLKKNEELKSEASFDGERYLFQWRAQDVKSTALAQLKERRDIYTIESEILSEQYYHQYTKKYPDSLIDFNDPEKKLAEELCKRDLDLLLNDLKERERQIIVLRFGLEDGRPRTMEEVGSEFGLTRERIRQIEAKALRKLRNPVRSKKVKDYLES